MENGEILDAQITASSEYNIYYGADKARLNLQHPGHSHAWFPSTASGSWLQVDFELQATISEVLTQGGGDYHSWWVKSYNLSHSSNGVNFYPYRQNGVIKVVEQILCGIICPSHSDVFTTITDCTAILFIYSGVKFNYSLELVTVLFTYFKPNELVTAKSYFTIIVTG